MALTSVMEGNYYLRKNIFLHPFSVESGCSSQVCEDSRMVCPQRQTHLSRQVRCYTMSPCLPGPSSSPTLLPTTQRPAYKVGWNSTFSFPSFCHFSIQSAKNGASSEGGFLMWVPVPQDWNKACQLIPGLPAQKSCSSPLPKAALCSHSLLSLPLWVPQKPGSIETSWRHCTGQYCQAKLETREAQLQVERGRCGQ